MVGYEWVVENVDVESEDILEPWHGDTFRDVMERSKDFNTDTTRGDVGLVRDANDGRSWAYLDEGKLPEYFTDSFGRITARVPQRFHKEVANGE